MESRFKNTVLFLISFCVIFLFLLLLLNGNKKAIEDVNIKTPRTNYETYKVDELVKLKNDSEWYVIQDSSNKEKEVYLISKDKINNEVIDDINTYLRDKYTDSLCNSLSISRDELSEVRLLNVDDICKLYQIEFNEFNYNFDISKYKLLENPTIVDYKIDNKNMSLCNEGLCNNDNIDIRVVIKIAKHFIKED